MPLKPLPYREVKRGPEAAGFAESSENGSHVKLTKVLPTGTPTAILPRQRELPIGTLRSIPRQAALTEDEFDRL